MVSMFQRSEKSVSRLKWVITLSESVNTLAFWSTIVTGSTYRHSATHSVRRSIKTENLNQSELMWLDSSSLRVCQFLSPFTRLCRWNFEKVWSLDEGGFQNRHTTKPQSAAIVLSAQKESWMHRITYILGLWHNSKKTTPHSYSHLKPPPIALSINL